MNIPVFYINKAGLGLVMGIISRAFNNIAGIFNKCYNRAVAALFTRFAINRFGYCYIALHIVIYVVLHLQVVG
jgi:hypothetical protein